MCFTKIVKTQLVSVTNGICTVKDEALERVQVSIKSTKQKMTPFMFGAIPDSGATKTIIGTKLARSYGMVQDSPCDRALITANGSFMKNDGKVHIEIKCGKHTFMTEAILSPDIHDEVLISKTDLIG